MSITINIEPFLEAVLKVRADAAGMTIEQFAYQLLEREADSPSQQHPRIRASLRTIQTLRGKLGPVPPGALAPELLYGDQ